MFLEIVHAGCALCTVATFPEKQRPLIIFHSKTVHVHVLFCDMLGFDIVSIDTK